MTNIYKTSFINSLGALMYIGIVSWVMQNGERLFGKMNNFLGPLALLLLFTLSALIVGGLILGKPMMLYLDGKKKEAVQLLLTTGGWLGLFTVLALLVLALKL